MTGPLDDPFAEGMEASHAGVAAEDCPYPVGSNEQIDWLKGYLQAEEDRSKAAEPDDDEIGFGPHDPGDPDRRPALN